MQQMSRRFVSRVVASTCVAQQPLLMAQPAVASRSFLNENRKLANKQTTRNPGKMNAANNAHHRNQKKPASQGDSDPGSEH